MPTVALWMYRNQGGFAVQSALKARLERAGCEVINNFDMRECYVEQGKVLTSARVDLSSVDVFYHMNADEQTPYQNEVLRALDFSGVEVINSWQSFSLAKDKFAANQLMAKAGINVPPSFFIHPQVPTECIQRMFSENGSVLVKPRRNHGGRGIVKFDRPDYFTDFVQATAADFGEYYVEGFIPFGRHDFRIEIFNGQVIGGYSRECAASSFKTNISSGGRMLDLMPSQDFAEVALRATSVFGITTTIVDMVRSENDNLIYVLEVNPIMGIFVEEACRAEKKDFFDSNASYCNDEIKLSLLTEFLAERAHLNAQARALNTSQKALKKAAPSMGTG
jgi:ribosomal protein S6--L-glutamate ligase